LQAKQLAAGLHDHCHNSRLTTRLGIGSRVNIAQAAAATTLPLLLLPPPLIGPMHMSLLLHRRQQHLLQAMMLCYAAATSVHCFDVMHKAPLGRKKPEGTCSSITACCGAWLLLLLRWRPRRLAAAAAARPALPRTVETCQSLRPTSSYVCPATTTSAQHSTAHAEAAGHAGHWGE